ncbi:biopolymer transporter ExbD [Burkholderiaceae bacterium DAT-1]|nr:biopolymer transporter ExbD [Burkholderiaceae bacterium DAT-1]
MGMSVGSGNSGQMEVMGEMNTTPLIDVMLVLLIMLIMTLPIQLHSVKLDFPPPSQNTNVEEPEKHTVMIDFDNTIYLDQNVVDMATLEGKLTQYASGPLENQPTVLIHPDKMASYKVVAAVLASSQRLGVTKIGLLGGEQFM